MVKPRYDRTTTPKWKRIRKAALERAEYQCEQCGRAKEDGYKLEVDHILPYSKGGEDEMSNVQVLCEAVCHRAKSNAEDAERRTYKPRPSIDWV